MEYEQIQQANAHWRKDFIPSAYARAALEHVVRTGALPDGAKENLVDELYHATPSGLRDPDRDPDDRHALVERRPDGIKLRISMDLWRTQPLGVICRAVNHRVNGQGSAVIRAVSPCSEDVNSDVMAVDHVALTIVPTPIWLARFFDVETGYLPIDGGNR